MTIVQIPNRPTGVQKRNVNELLSDFDVLLTKLLQLDGGNLNGGVLTEAKFDSELAKKLGLVADGVVAADYAEVLTSESTSNTSAAGVALATPGPTCTVEVAGPAMVWTHFFCAISPGNGQYGYDPVFNTQFSGRLLLGGSNQVVIYNEGPGSIQHTARYRSTDGLSATFGNRKMSMIAYSL